LKTSVEVRIPSRLGYEKVAMGTAASMARLMGFSDDRIEDLKTAVGEACINAIEHGNHMDALLPVGVVLSSVGDQLEVTVHDTGQGVDASHKAPAPNIDRKIAEAEDARGMGIFLIQSLVDEAEWVHGTAQSGGSFVRLVIRLDKPEEESEL
jgi:serine/threonine-protein kinase RsbW